MVWIENRVVNGALVSGQIVVSVGDVCPEADGLSRTDFHGLFSKEETERPAQNKEMLFHAVLVSV